MNPTAALLRSCSWHAEKIFKRRGKLDNVFWLAEDAAGVRRSWETACTAPETISDDQVLQGLAADARIDMAEIGAMRFAVAFLMRRTITYTPIELDLPPTIRRSEFVVVEAHDVHGLHLRAQHEIPHSPRLILGAMSAPEAVDDSIYGAVLSETAAAA